MTNFTQPIWRVALPVPLRRIFDYLPPDNSHVIFEPGLRVKVPFGRRMLVGITLSIESHTHIAKNKLKRIAEVLDEKSLLTTDIIQLCEFASRYYHAPIGEVISTALPTRLRQGKSIHMRQTRKQNAQQSIQKPLADLNGEQQHAVSTVIQAKGFHPFLLFGVTGSGKTEVYLHAAADVLAMGLQVLVLIPEIALSPQTLARFQAHFNERIVLFHSGLSENERCKHWLAAANQEASIVIGTRSAVFVPMPKLGLIIIDEEHDASYKQQEGFHYSARDLALKRAKQADVPIVLGSATPSLETWQAASANRYQLLELPFRAKDATLPQMQICDVRGEQLQEGISRPLLAKIKKHLQEGNQVLLFLNRRGFAPMLRCHACGFVVECAHCDAKLVWHKKTNDLRCHHCEARVAILHQCPACETAELSPMGIGTQRLEQVLQLQFKNIPVTRIDTDATKQKGSLSALLDQLHQGGAQILIGTQMVAKGHDLPHLTLVAILDIDAALFGSDFRAIERMGQLIMQVAGRAGRGQRPGEVLIQTHHPEHPWLMDLQRQNYQQFAQALLRERKLAQLPPYSYLALIRAQAKHESRAFDFLKQVRHLFANTMQRDSYEVLGPVDALMTRKAGLYRAQLLIQAKERLVLHEMLRQMLQLAEADPNFGKGIQWNLDIDPLETI